MTETIETQARFSQAALVFLQQLKPGDILKIYHPKYNFFSRVALYVGEGFFVEATFGGVKKMHWTQGDYSTGYNIIAMRPICANSELIAQAVSWAKAKAGLKHNVFIWVCAIIWHILSFLKCPAFFYNLFIKDKYWSCTNFVLEAYTNTVSLLNHGTSNVPSDVLIKHANLTQVAQYTSRL